MAKKFLETERLVLRQIEGHDLPKLKELDSNPDVMRYIGDGAIRTNETQFTSTLTRIKKYYAEGKGFGVWKAETKIGNEFIGWFLLKPLPDNSAIEIGYRLLPKFWKQGYATEMTKELLRYGFEQLKLDKIVGVTHPENIASQKVLLKSGLRFKSTSKYMEWDVNLYEMLKP